jgi:inosose dehydratase
VSITLDTGHVAAAGGDPAECVARWGDRVDHVHVKDVEVAAVERARVNGELFRMALASRPLGAGDVDFDPLFQALDRAGYDGWLVIERDHDVPIGTPVDDWLPAVMSEQSANFRWLEERLALLPRRGATEMTISPTRS